MLRTRVTIGEIRLRRAALQLVAVDDLKINGRRQPAGRRTRNKAAFLELRKGATGEVTMIIPLFVCSGGPRQKSL